MFEAHIECWMYDADTADWLATDPGWLAVQYDDAKDIAVANGKTPTGAVSLKSYTLIGPLNDGLDYDFVYEVAVA
jgi:hypothetical protein